MLQSKKKTQVLETLLDLVNAYSNFFHEGRSYYQDLDVFNQQLAIEIDAMKNKTNTLDKQLEKRHTGKFFFSNALCSRNFQNVKLRLDFVEI